MVGTRVKSDQVDVRGIWLGNVMNLAQLGALIGLIIYAAKRDQSIQDLILSSEIQRVQSIEVKTSVDQARVEISGLRRDVDRLDKNK